MRRILSFSTAAVLFFAAAIAVATDARAGSNDGLVVLGVIVLGTVIASQQGQGVPAYPYQYGYAGGGYAICGNWYSQRRADCLSAVTAQRAAREAAEQCRVHGWGSPFCGYRRGRY